MKYKIESNVPFQKRPFRGRVGSDYVSLMLTRILSFEAMDYFTTEIDCNMPIHDPFTFDYWRETEGCESTGEAKFTINNVPRAASKKAGKRLYAPRFL